MTIVWPEDGRFNDALAQWAAERIWPGQNRSLGGPYRCMGIYRKDELIGVVAYQNWSEHAETIEISVGSSSPRWLTRQVLREMYDAPFNRIGCQMVVHRISAEDTSLASILERIGATGYRIPRLRGRNHDEIIYTLTKEAWEGKWQ